MHIRPAMPSQDHERVMAMLHATPAPPCTAEQFRTWYDEFPETGRKQEWVAVDASGKVIGYANATCEDPKDAPELYEAFVLVDPAHLRQGIGTTLLDLAEHTARSEGARHIKGTFDAGNFGAATFLDQRGYSVERHTIDARLELGAFDESARFPGVMTALERDFQFMTLADDPSEASLAQLYEFSKLIAPGFPGWDPDSTYPPYDAWRTRLLKNYEGCLDLVVIASHAGRYIGSTRMVPENEPGVLYTPYTAVHPEFRGRKVALALKLFAVRIAQRRGATALTTNNDAYNKPVLAINEKMGFVPEVATHFVTKSI